MVPRPLWVVASITATALSLKSPTYAFVGGPDPWAWAVNAARMTSAPATAARNRGNRACVSQPRVSMERISFLFRRVRPKTAAFTVANARAPPAFLGITEGGREERIAGWRVRYSRGGCAGAGGQGRRYR